MGECAQIPGYCLYTASNENGAVTRIKGTTNFQHHNRFNAPSDGKVARRKRAQIDSLKQTRPLFQGLSFQRTISSAIVIVSKIRSGSESVRPSSTFHHVVPVDENYSR